MFCVEEFTSLHARIIGEIHLVTAAICYYNHPVSAVCLYNHPVSAHLLDAVLGHGRHHHLLHLPVLGLLGRRAGPGHKMNLNIDIIL